MKPRLKAALINVALLATFTFGAVLLGEAVVRIGFKDNVVLFPRYHTDVQYGDFVLRRIRPNAHFRHTSTDGSWTFTTNAQGFRNVEDFTYEKPSNTFRVLSLGDSHTQGYEVRQQYTFSAVMDRALGARGWNVEVMNAFARQEPTGKPRTVAMRFMLSPVEIQGDGRVERIVFERNRLEERDGGWVAAVPTGEFLVYYLQEITTAISTFLLNLAGIPAFRDGLFITLPGGNFEVAKACSGFRYLNAGVAMAMLIAYLVLRTAWIRVGYIVLVGALFVFVNGLSGSYALIQSRQLGISARMMSTPTSVVVAVTLSAGT